MSPTIPWTAGRWTEAGRCGCGETVYPDSFRDRASWRDFGITGLCQRCQDTLYFGASAHDAHRLYPVRRGVLAATVTRHGAVVELAALPFVFIAPEARIAWEARFLLRAGAPLAPLDPWDELLALKPALESHQVRLTEVDEVDAAQVRAALDVDLAVVRDAAARAALAGLALAPGARSAALADDIPWRALLGAPLPELLSPWTRGRAPVSVLRACALLALGLHPPPGSGASAPLRWLVRAHRTRFPELDWALPAPR